MCHELEAAGTSGAFGGNLDDGRPSEAAVLKAIVDGPGTMPANILNGVDAQEVAAYVARVTASDGGA